jgi:hypothetical protein
LVVVNRTEENMSKRSYITLASFIDYRTGRRVPRRRDYYLDAWYRAVERVALQCESEEKIFSLMGGWYVGAIEHTSDINAERWEHLTAYAIAVFRHSRLAVGAKEE